MSALTSFIAAAATAAKSIIGAESLTISGGSAVAAILNEATHGREYSEIGMDGQTTLDAVVDIATWTAAYPLAPSEYVGKTATARGLTLRVRRVSLGQSFARVSLSDTGEP